VPEETQEAADPFAQGRKTEETEDAEAAEAGRVAVNETEAGEHVQSTEESD
jgi:hypothetical protein